MCILYRVRYEGLENIPKDSGFILACNHRSYCDPLFIAHKLRQPIHYMAKAELFRNPVIAFILRGVNAFPVARGTGDRSAIDTAISIIKGGEVMGMFPEGTRSKDGQPLRPRSGVAIVAAETIADVLPCAVCFEGKLRFRTNVTVRYGKLIPAEKLGAQVDSRATIKAASRMIMDEIVGLLNQ
jgi:1-acyl-sn-glycerol-3-phosphate acyltransferase